MALQAENDQGTEVIALGKGIAFGKKKGDWADETQIEKIFSLAIHPFATRLAEILGEIPQEYFRLTNKIVDYANQTLQTQLSSNIYTALTDHIYHAVLRAKQQKNPTSGMTFDIQRLYKQEFTIASWAIKLINKEMSVEMGSDEASFIALHIFNARTDSQNLVDAL